MTLIKDPAAPATPAQASYLADLVKNRDLPDVCEKYRLVTTLGTLQKGQASEWITALLAAPKKGAKPVTLINGTVVGSLAHAEAKVQADVAAEEIAATLTELPAFGYYEIDGTFYYWDVTGKDSVPTLRRLQITTTYDGKKKGSWKKIYSGQTAWNNGTSTKAQMVEATFVPYAGKHWNYKSAMTKKVWVPGVLVASVLGTQAKPLTQAEAAAKGKAVGFCIRCGATLTDPVSVANGIGPVCATYWG